jgi:ATP-dependent Lon protease
LAEVPENLRKEMKMHFVDTMDQVLKIALEGPLPQMLEETSQTGITPITPQATESPATHQ